MIDSLLKRLHRRITLDWIMIDDNSLSLNESDINQKITSHFQNFAGPTTSTNTIPNS